MFIKGEAPEFTIKQMIYDLMDLCYLQGIEDGERGRDGHSEEYFENTMEFLGSIERMIEELANGKDI